MIKFNLDALQEVVGDGRIFSVGFIKRSGGYRNMVCRTGVGVNQSGGDIAYDPAKKNLLSVYDMQNNGYRTIPVEGITRLKAHGQTFIAGGAS